MNMGKETDFLSLGDKINNIIFIFLVCLVSRQAKQVSFWTYLFPVKLSDKLKMCVQVCPDGFLVSSINSARLLLH